MRSPGSYVARWIVDDPQRWTLTPNTDRAFYTAMTNIALVLMALAAVVFTLSIFGLIA